MEFSSQRREMLLFSTNNMAAVTSRAHRQFCPQEVRQSIFKDILHGQPFSSKLKVLYCFLLLMVRACIKWHLQIKLKSSKLDIICAISVKGLRRFKKRSLSCVSLTPYLTSNSKSTTLEQQAAKTRKIGIEGCILHQTQTPKSKSNRC